MRRFVEEMEDGARILLEKPKELEFRLRSGDDDEEDEGEALGTWLQQQRDKAEQLAALLHAGALPALSALRWQEGPQGSAALRLKVEKTIKTLEAQLREETRNWRGWTRPRQTILDAVR